MNVVAINQARSRLRRATKALDAMASATEIEPFEDAWSDFLLATGGVYSKLKEGAKGHPKSEGWFGRAVNLRRTDPLLRYIHHARNSDEHGLEFGAAYIAKIDFTGMATREFVMIDGQPHISLTVENADLQVRRVEPTLAPVIDTKYGDNFYPPDTHLGQAVDSHHPVRVAGLALAYLFSLLEEADRLAQPRRSTSIDK